MKIDLMELRINADRRSKILWGIGKRLDAGKKTFIVTPYSEFFYYSARNYEFEQAVNSADFALPDGVSIPWMAYYLSLPLTLTSYAGKVIQAFWQAVRTLPLILFKPSRIYSIVPEKIPGSDFFWDLAALADKKHLKIFLLGGFGQTPKIVGEKILAKFPNAQICGYSNENPESPGLVERVNAAHPDILMVAFGPVKQETWIAKNLSELNCKIAIGLGGTFDYVAGTKSQPPRWMRRVGIEWAYRLVTQPTRVKRIWNATALLILGTVREKVFRTMPLRENVCGVIINPRGEVFVATSRHADIDNSRTFWQFPQGGVDRGEMGEQAVLRELREETGSSSYVLLGRGKKVFWYHWRHFHRPLFFRSRGNRGQRQVVFFLLYTAPKDDFHLDNHELKRYLWVPMGGLLDLLGPVRHKMYHQTVEPELAHYIEAAKAEPVKNFKEM